MSSTTARETQPPKTTGPSKPADSLVSCPNAAQLRDRPVIGRPVQRRRAINPSSAQALAMLTRQPVFATPVPQVHIGPRGTDGSFLVDDRASDRRFLVYTPRLDSQFRAGYRAGLWYLRAPGDVEPSPRSPGFPTAVAAIDNLRLSLASHPETRATALASASFGRRG
jgi:hypothetical protein